MKQVQELLPWKVTDISVYPYGADYWSMNPSIHLDNDGTWRCVTRIVDYAMPDGVTIRSKARLAGQQTKNAMLILDPDTWRPIKIYKMQEKDGLPRASTPHVGFEDMRLFKTDKGGLQGIAASLHLWRDRAKQAASEHKPQHQPPEQVLLSFDDRYNIVAAAPIRGDGWSGTAQKNWVPFDHCAEPRFLYSINRGSMFDDRGKLHGDAARVRPSIHAEDIAPTATFETRTQPSTEGAETPLDESNDAPAEEPAKEVGGVAIRDEVRKKKKLDRKTSIRGGDVRIVRGGRIKLDTISARPTARPASGSSAPRSARAAAPRNADEASRMMGAGRVRLPGYEGLRGGSQLVRVAADTWLGLAHEMKFVSGRKHYWHTFYLVDPRGKMTAVSEPMKLASEGIEFAAGIAIDGDRVVVSFGVDDMACRLGETSLAAMLEKLRPFRR